VAQFVSAAPELLALGARVVVIGNGSTDSLGFFADEHPGIVTIVTDPEKVAYKALSLVHGVGGMKAFTMVGAGVRAWRKGYRQGHLQGDPLQQGGVFVIDRQGHAVFAQRSGTAGDHANLPDVMAAVQGLPGTEDFVGL
jgi:hypothetical protein